MNADMQAEKKHVRYARDEGVYWKYAPAHGSVDERDAKFADLVVEADSTRAAWLAASANHGLVCPQVVQIDHTRRRIALEAIPGLVPLSNLIYSEHSNAAQLLRRAGTALAFFHANMRLDKRRPVSIPRDHLSADFSGPMHGDFVPTNIFFQPTTQRLCVLDWSPAPMLNSGGNWGDHRWDVVWMTYTIITNTPIVTPQVATDRLSQHFLEGYDTSALPQMKCYSGCVIELLKGHQLDNIAQSARLLLQVRKLAKFWTTIK